MELPARGLRPRDIDTFSAVARALLPALADDDPFLAVSIEDLGVRARFPDLFARIAPAEQRELLLALRLLGSRAGGAALHGIPRPFTDLSAETAERSLNRMATHRLLPPRQVFGSLKKLTGFLAASGNPISRIAMHYPDPGPPPRTQRRISATVIDESTELTCDVVIVGSGAGGGVAAGVLAEAGLDVVVLEKGGLRTEADYTHDEAEAYEHLYLDAALGATDDKGIGLLAGSCVGGGTVVNYTTSFATPDSIRAEWDRISGFHSLFSGPEYEAASQAVKRRINANDYSGLPSSSDALMEKGLRELGWHVGSQDRNVTDCPQDDSCGFCVMGCRLGAKQSTLVTWLEDAFNLGARIVADADVRSILTSGGRATGVAANVNGHAVTVHARATVLAAGALNSPAIMLRSGLDHPAVGENLRLHPVTVVWGRYQDEIHPWSGTMQSRYSDHIADLDNNGYGIKIETGPAHPALVAALVGWGGGEQYKRHLADYRHWSPIAAILRDRDPGTVTTRRNGDPRWSYRVSDRDQGMVRAGVAAAATIHAASGATEIMSNTLVPVTWRPDRAPLGDFLTAVDGVGYGSHQTTYGSWHQMGTLRMGSDPATSAVDAHNEVHGTRDLYVMDGSTFPTASGVNPMITIETIAHRAASTLAAKLT